MKLTFLGAAGGVTGSCTMLQTGAARLLVDCGMFQGSDEDFNRERFLFRPGEVDAVLLTHAHIDHSGLLPRLVAEGFRGPIYATPATIDLSRLLLEDSARIQRREAEGESKRRIRAGFATVEPLYDLADVARTMDRFRPVRYHEPLRLAEGAITATWRDAGHILGSASILVEAGKAHRICFSGDVGSRERPILRDPEPAPECDYLVLESTYGDRDHPPATETDARLAEILEHAASDGGTALIPAFAVERAQEVLYRLKTLVEARSLPFPEVYLDSPLAVKATDAFLAHPECYDEAAAKRLREGGLFRMPQLHIIRDVQDSMRLNEDPRPKLIVAASGMCEAGPILHHLRHHLWRPEADVIFVGYQAKGTLGRRILEGFTRVRIHGRVIAVRARIHEMTGLSAHADRGGLSAWARTAGRPKHTFLNHGEPAAASAFAQQIQRDLDHRPVVPKRGEGFEI